MRGGARDGAGRPPVPTGKAMKMRSIRLHDNEYEQVKEYVKKLREDKNRMDLKATLDLYDQGKADLMDVTLAWGETAGLGDPVQSKRALDAINKVLG